MKHTLSPIDGVMARKTATQHEGKQKNRSEMSLFAGILHNDLGWGSWPYLRPPTIPFVPSFGEACVDVDIAARVVRFDEQHYNYIIFLIYLYL